MARVSLIRSIRNIVEIEIQFYSTGVDREGPDRIYQQEIKSTSTFIDQMFDLEFQIKISSKYFQYFSL